MNQANDKKSKNKTDHLAESSAQILSNAPNEETRRRLQFQDAVIEHVTLNGKALDVVFSMIPSILVKDAFGFDFEPVGQHRCTITMKNPQYEFLPKPGVVNDGHIALGELCYISIFPPDLKLECPCFLMIEQPVAPKRVASDGDALADRNGSRGDDSDGDLDGDLDADLGDSRHDDSETFMIVGDELTVEIEEI